MFFSISIFSHIHCTFHPGFQYEISGSFNNGNTLSLILSDMGDLPQSVEVWVSLVALHSSDLLAGERV